MKDCSLQLGWNSNSFQSHRLEEVLPILADLGYGAVAITPDVPHLDPRYTTPEDLRRVGARCAELGLEVVVETGARFLLDPARKHRPNLLELDDSKDIRLKFLRHMVEWCDMLGAKVLSFWSGSIPEGQSKEGAATRLVDACENLHTLSERYGVLLGLEPEPGHFIATLNDYANFTNANPDLVKLTFDTGHILANEEGQPSDHVGQWKNEIVNLQLDDARHGIHEHLPPGEGEVDWPAFWEAVRLAELRCPACWELSRDSHRFHELVQAQSPLV
ncbi:MAG: sugar phosphate isomerase/epimerase family protein [Planctomycetota bacterium]|jgi:sugar phosphate isomerase/epimerase|nr:sugar phosphate isomerase/epimerase family protein [Planctomycetota bacterium]MDP6940924.1 sugar phosphate isomerase/epimerase family protein [Planctomycetota bacterium]